MRLLITAFPRTAMAIKNQSLLFIYCDTTKNSPNTVFRIILYITN